MSLLSVKHLTKHFPIYKGWIRKKIGAVYALNGVSLEVHPEELVAVVGESGSGKSTLASCVIRLMEPTRGSIWFNGKNFLNLEGRALRQERQNLQMVFQDPFSSLNPRKTIDEILCEPLFYHFKEMTQDQALQKACDVLALVGLSYEVLKRYPHEFSGGQQQRIAMGRALILSPKLLLLDEAIASLDVSYQAQIMNLLDRLKHELSLGYLFIAHDLRVVRHAADRVIVLYMGEVMEEGDTEEVFSSPKHPYTRTLLASIPREYPWEKKERVFLPQNLPSPTEPPQGCPFRSRCSYARAECSNPVPQRETVGRRGIPHRWSCIHKNLNY